MSISFRYDKTCVMSTTGSFPRHCSIDLSIRCVVNPQGALIMKQNARHAGVSRADVTKLRSSLPVNRRFECRQSLLLLPTIIGPLRT